MSEETSRLYEFWEAFKRLEQDTPGLEVSAGKFLMIPPGDVRLAGFSARLRRPDGSAVAMLADAESVIVGPDAGEPEQIPRTSPLRLDLSQGYAVAGTPVATAAALAHAVLQHMHQFHGDTAP